jgi:1,4-dihydroxy-2-naphthoate octaprenyltransferase
MTLTSIAIAGLLAVGAPELNLALFALAGVGSVIAHAANNMINDLFDLQDGLDTASYPRSQYAPHPVLAGLITRSGLVRAIFVANALDAIIMLILFLQRGWPVVAFALAGLLISVGYVAPPLRLKAHGFGEPSVALIWGPIMVGGTYYAAVGSLPLGVWLASIPYALLVTTVLLGKHIDKLPWDRAGGVKTLPVITGEAGAKKMTVGLMYAFYGSIPILIVAGALPIWTLISFVGIPRLLKTRRTYARARPAEAPPRYPIWPLWFGPWAFLHATRAGAMLVVGLALAAFFPWKLSV